MDPAPASRLTGSIRRGANFRNRAIMEADLQRGLPDLSGICVNGERLVAAAAAASHT